MKPNPYLFLTKIKNVPYLLPFGQGIEDRLSGISTNESGLLLWEELCRGADRTALLEKLCAFYEAGAEDRSVLEQDLDAYLSDLWRQGFLLRDDGPPPAAAHDFRYAKIGPLLLALQLPKAVFENYFSDFETTLPEDSGADLTLQLMDRCPPQYTTGSILVRNREILISDNGREYLFLPQQSQFVYELRVSKDGADAVLYCRYEEESAACREEIFHAIRFAFLVTAQTHGLCVLHSASVLYKGKAWLFSGYSGAGKSTHTKLWHELFGVPLLNGDLNLLGIKDRQPVCCGLPWCGTSEIYTAKNYPLGGVVFLKQAPYNRVSSLSADREILSLVQRMITPGWTQAGVRRNLELAETLAEKIRVFRLECTKQPEAAEIMRAAIDG